MSLRRTTLGLSRLSENHNEFHLSHAIGWIGDVTTVAWAARTREERVAAPLIARRCRAEDCVMEAYSCYHRCGRNIPAERTCDVRFDAQGN